MATDIVVVGESRARLSKPRQAFGLAMKAISYQKRQWFTNICCISLCPLMMVMISAALGIVLQGVINRSQTPNELVYCSNVPNMNSFNIPLWNLTNFEKLYPSTEINNDEVRRKYKGSTLSIVFHANWARVTSLGVRGPPGAAGTTFLRPCVFWHEEDYPESPLYERNPGPNATGAFRRDATRLSQPLGGWPGAILRGAAVLDPNTLNIFSQYQEKTWYIYDFEESAVSSTLMGSKALPAPIRALPNGSTPAFDSPINSTTGILGTIPTRYYLEINSLSDTGAQAGRIVSVPYYNLTRGGRRRLDDELSNQLNGVILEIAKLDKTAITGGSTNNLTRSNQVFIRANSLLQNLPHGALYFTKIDHGAKKYSWDAHIGSDIRVASSSNFPPPGRRLLIQQTQLNNAVLRNGNVSGLGNSVITHGFRILPFVRNTLVSIEFGGIIGNILYPFGISFLLPIFAIILIQEKEQRILVIMKMNGMTSLPYYVSHYVTFLILYVISAVIFLLSGTLGRLTLFTITQRELLYLLFFIWGNNLISLAFFFSSLFDRTRFALVSIFLIVLCSVVIGLVIDDLFADSNPPELYYVWPPFAFYRVLSVLNRQSYDPTLLPGTFARVGPGFPLFAPIIALVIEIPIYLLLAFYLNAIVPSEFGVAKPWHFPFTDFYKAYIRKPKPNQITEEEMAVAVQIDEKEIAFEDEDVKQERKRVLETKLSPEEYPLVMQNMRKVYAGRGGQGPKLAVKDVTFAVEKGITFGLLGPNGAGKTTLISILTGLYETSSGTASVGGFNIKTESDGVYKSIGICPQFDIQWDDLTVGEHLYFYSRLKGVIKEDEDKAVATALAEVSLSSFRDRLTKGLSGGERRRLSIAIALLGDPKVVFLDEPTTGLDPEVRRLIWDIVNTARVGRTIILTTHSMEEAEALCQRIGIMAKGTLRCHAAPGRLKKLYGNGFKIFINTNLQDTERATKYIESLLPSGFRKVDAFSTSTSYEFQAGAGVLSKLFLNVEKDKNKNGILDYGIGETSLEEVFLRLISEDDASAVS